MLNRPIISRIFFILTAYLFVISPCSFTCDGYGYGSSGGVSRTITITPRTPPNYPDDTTITFTASVNCTDPSIQIGITATRQDGTAMTVLPAPSGSAPFTFSVHLVHSKSTFEPEAVEIKAFVVSGESATPDQLTIKVYPYKKYTPPEGSMSFSGGVYQSGTYKFSGPGEVTTFTATATDKDRAEVPGNFAIRDDLFEKTNAFEWNINGTTNGQEVTWTAPAPATANGPTTSEIILKAKDDGLYAIDWDYHQEIDRIAVNIFDLDGLTIRQGGIEAQLIQVYDPATATQLVIAHSLNTELGVSDTVVPILRYELINSETGGVVATDERQSSSAQLTIPKPGRYKFRITNVVKEEAVTSVVYTWYGITVTPENFSLNYLPDPVTFNNQPQIDQKTGKVQELTQIAIKFGSAASNLRRTLDEGRSRYADWDRIYLSARRVQDATNPAFVELGARLQSIFAAGGGIASAAQLFLLQGQLEDLGRQLSEGRNTLQELGPLLRDLRANPRISPPPKTLEVKTVPGNIAVSSELSIISRKTADTRFSLDLVQCDPPSFTTDQSGVQHVQVSALGNLGKTRIKFTASQGGAPAIATVEVTGITQQEALAAADAYVRQVQNIARAFQLALTVGFAALGLFLTVLFFLGSLVSGLLALVALAAGLVALMTWLTGSTVSPLQRSIRQQYPSA